jgi:oligosaccharide 4-alpha-D-glucosyltransferase
MVKLKTFILFVLSLSFSVLSGQNSQRIFKNYKKANNKLVIVTNDGTYIVKPFSDKIIETAFIPLGEKYNTASEAVVLKPNGTIFIVKENSTVLTLATKGILVKITKKPFQITYFYKNRELISERKGYVKTDKYQVLDFNLTSDEVLYGGGARALPMNRRGYKLQLYNRAHYGYETHSELMNYTLPLVFSSKKYALLFDNAPIGFLDLDNKKDNSLQYQTISGRKTYQVIAGDTWLDLVNQYTTLTGKQPMIPRWALGNFSSRFGYHSQKEVINTIDAFKKDSIPVDAIIIDLYWFGKTIKGTMGNLNFYKDSFPSPKKMIAELKTKGIKTILVTEPFILKTSDRWQEVVDAGILGKNKLGAPYEFDFYFGHTGLLDIFKPKGEKWFWNIYKTFTKDYGVAGWWGDLGEPEVHPSDMIHATGTGDEVHNIYGHKWAKLVYEGYQKDFPNQRPFILMRAGYSGSQRYGMIPWSGDVNRSWGGLQSQPSIALQMGIQGLGFMHSDLGGFAGANLDDELYTRWLQYGVFQPIYRPHAQEEVPSEPVFREAKTKTLAKKAIALRYQLLPYNYTLAFENHINGSPLMRPLFFEETADKAALINDKTYLWGHDFLVSPIVKAELKTQEVSFPSNNNWFDFYTDKKIAGGQTKEIGLHPDYIPTYVRGGAFIPMIKTIPNTENYSLKNFDLHFYYDAAVTKSNGKLYNDDGKTPNGFEKGKYEIIHFYSKTNRQGLVLKIATQLGSQMAFSNKTVNLTVHGIAKKPKKVKGYNFKWSPKNHTLTIRIELNKSNPKNIKIKLSH